jgi:hypothetical protein
MNFKNRHSQTCILTLGPEMEIIMRSTNITTCCAAFAAVLTLAGGSSAAAEKLGDILRESGWDRIIGTWVDADTKGAKFKTTYAWRFKNTVVEITTTDGKKETVALMGLNAKTGDVYNLAADNQGAASLGKWELADGDAVLELGFVNGEGQEGGLRIRHHLEDNDTLVVTIELPQPITFKLIRAK